MRVRCRGKKNGISACKQEIRDENPSHPRRQMWAYSIGRRRAGFQCDFPYLERYRPNPDDYKKNPHVETYPGDPDPPQRCNALGS